MDIYGRTPTVSPVYIAQPAPDSAGQEEAPKMGLFSVIKTLFVPAMISFALYLLITYLLVPIWKRYRGRYSQYLPLDTISTRTTSFRQRIQAMLARYIVPSSWRDDYPGNQLSMDRQNVPGSEFDDEDGEELYEVESHGREALSLDARRGRIEDGGRLSRDLEEGFRDESDDETEGADQRESSARGR